jgi:hypothetical protein
MTGMNRQNGLSMVLLVLVIVVAVFAVRAVQRGAQESLQPLQQANRALQTQVAGFLNPTPTVIPDPATYIHEVRALARLETIHYSLEKVIVAETGQGPFAFLFGDRLLLVAHGYVIAGVDLGKLEPQDMQLRADVLYVALPAAEVFAATLDNQKSYIYDRDTGLFTRGNVHLETAARQAAEQEILKAALEAGILEQAGRNAEVFLELFFRALGYPQVIFER